MALYPSTEEQLTTDQYAWRIIRQMFAGIGWGLLGLFLTVLAVCPPFINRLLASALGEVSPAHDLLTGCLRAYCGTAIVFGVGAVIQVRLIVMTVIRFVRERPAKTQLEKQLEDEFISLTYLSGPGPDLRRAELKKQLDQYAAAAVGRTMGLFILIALPAAVLVLYYIILFAGGAASAPIAPQTHIPALQAELEQLEEDELERAEVWVYPKAETAHLPGAWGSSYQAFARRYHVVSWEPGGEWVEILVPDALGFSLNMERPYRESQSIAWNLENAQRYEITYTSDFHLVEAITPIP